MPPGRVLPRRHAQPPRRARERLARRLPHPGRGAGRRALAGAAARGLRGWPRTWGWCSGPTGPVPDASLMVRRELDEWFASLPTDAERGRRPARRRAALVLHRRQRLRGPRRPGSACRSARWPTPRTSCWRATCWPRLRQGLPSRRRRHPFPRLPPARAVAALVRRVARPARGRGHRGARRRLAGSRSACSARCATTSPWPAREGQHGSARAADRRGSLAPPRAARGRRGARARARTGCRRRCAGCARSRAAPASTRCGPVPMSRRIQAAAARPPPAVPQRPAAARLPHRQAPRLAASSLVRILTSPLRLVGLERGVRAQLSPGRTSRRVACLVPARGPAA